MSLREHFNIDGVPKTKRSKEAAEDIAANWPNMNAYECTFCGFWHVGSKNEEK